MDQVVGQSLATFDKLSDDRAERIVVSSEAPAARAATKRKAPTAAPVEAD